MIDTVECGRPIYVSNENTRQYWSDLWIAISMPHAYVSVQQIGTDVVAAAPGLK